MPKKLKPAKLTARQAKIITRLCIDEVLATTRCQIVKAELLAARRWVQSVEVKKRQKTS